MIKRIVEISSEAAYIHLKHGQLVIKRDGSCDGQIPIEDLGLLLVSNPAITCSNSVLTACLKNNVAVVLCDEKHMPSGMILPLTGHSTQTQIISAQTGMSMPRQKQLWKSIVRAKIRAQAQVLARTKNENGALIEWAKQVRSGDPANMEARAARFYWKKLFGKDFRRERYGLTPNPLLNYGYAVVRACVARALVGAGLHPSIGLHHRNKYNDFCLADDLLEPLRPLVDFRVWELWNDNHSVEIDKTTKKVLLELLSEKVKINESREELMISMHHYAASLRQSFMENASFRIPVW